MRLRLLLPAAALLAACNAAPSKGEVRPTVEGGATPASADAAKAKAEFTRSSGPLTATLVDAAWVRLEADPDRAQERYPEYFAGYTSFQVRVETYNFARPTDETYLLEDSLGARVTAKPTAFHGDTQSGFGPKHAASFDLVFPHAMTKGVRWLRLTRQGEGGGVVEWSFP